MTDADDEAADRERATRRQFFRVFGRQTASSAGSVLAGVEALRRTSQDALGDLISGEEEPVRASAPPAEVPSAAASTASGVADYRSPYRFTGSSVEILDQAELPARASIIECLAATEVASAMRRGAMSGGPVLGQVAAYTVAMVLSRNPDSTEYARQQALRGAADTLRAARPANRALTAALQRMLARADAAEASAPQSVGAALLDEADQIAAESAADHARLGQLGAEAMRQAARAAAEQGRLMSVLMHGDQGPLAGGQIGTGTAVIQSLAASGLPVHAWLTEAAPLHEGRRAAWQLGHLDVAHTLVPDTALAWLLRHRRLDVLMLRAETIAANGDLLAPIGSLVAAQLARSAGVPVVACVPLVMLDEGLAAGDAAPSELRLPAPSPGAAPRIDPALDVVPADLLDALLTDEGPLLSPHADALCPAAAAREARHGRPRADA
jgi:methylthioribose-1-phosphate isomerase